MKKRILVVDDDAGLQDIFRLILERAGFSVEVYGNGNALLHDQYDKPDLFLLDKQLSGLDGLDICRFLKNQPSTAHLPIIMISANPDIGKLSVAAGADDFIEKPFEMNYLVQMIKKYTQQQANPLTAA